MLVASSFLSDPNHGKTGCISCHGGDPRAKTRAAAHVGMYRDPTILGAKTGCACHSQIAEDSAKSLHTTLAGIKASLAQRAGTTTLGTELNTAYNNHCARCHSSCGDCHVSVPNAAGGGLLAKHRFQKTPSMTMVCTACHGSRVGNEYKGENAGVPADVHYNKGMQCTSCHKGVEMHGTGQAAVDHRYKVTSAPRCKDCHPDDAQFKATTAHTLHRDANGASKLSCQVCHAISYKHCSSCHVQINAESKPVYEVNAPSHESLMTFKIGLNPAADALHPEKWVTVRHVPADPDNYAHYGANLQGAFATNPTWRLATPHNIQRKTPQNAACANCHNKRELFLAPADLAPYEVQANSGAVVPDAMLPK